MNENPNRSGDDATVLGNQDPSASDEAAAAGSISSRFQLGAELGRGGMGIVYRGHDRNLNREVALKVLNENLRISHEGSLGMFMFEAEILGRLEHPGVIPVYERSTDTEGKEAFYAMKIVRGDTLEQILAHCDAETFQDPASISRNVALLIEVCRTIGYAHTLQIIHRDLKPENIMIDEHANALVVDWGLALDLNEPSTLPEKGAIEGTPAYMSPEQALGEPDSLGPHTDVYALGLVLYKLLTGRLAQDADTRRELNQLIIHETPAAPRSLNSNVPRSLDAICMKCLSKNTEARYPDASGLLKDLENYRDDLPITAYEPGMRERIGSWSRRRPRTAATLASTSLLTMLILTVLATAITLEVRGRNNLLNNLVSGMKVADATLDRYDRAEDAVDMDSEEGARLAALRKAENDTVGRVMMDQLRGVYGAYVGRMHETEAEVFSGLDSTNRASVERIIVRNAESLYDRADYMYANFVVFNFLNTVEDFTSDDCRIRLNRVKDQTLFHLKQRWGDDYFPPWEEVNLEWVSPE